MKKLITHLMVLVLCLTFISPSIAYATTIKINKTKITLGIGKTDTLEITGTTKKVKWSTSDKAVATVSSKGKVAAKAVGTATITASVSTKKYKCKVTVNDPKVNVIFSAMIFDDTSLEEYIKEIEKENPDYISVKKYDDEHYVASMLESYRKSLIDSFNKEIEPTIATYINDPNYDGMFTDVKYDKLFTKVKIYAAKDKYSTLNSFSIIFSLVFLSDYYQAINLVEIDDRSFILEIIDIKTKEIIYTLDTKEE